MAMVYVGPEQRLFYVHKDLICNKIPYFYEIFSSYIGDPNSYISLPYDDDASFDVLIEWVYSGKLRSIHATPPAVNSSPTSTSTLAWDPFSLYLLASKLLLQPLQDTIMDIWVSNLSNTARSPTPETCRLVYSQTVSNSPPRRLFAQCVASIIVGQHRLHDFSSNDWSIGDSTSLIQQEPDLLSDVLAVLKTHPFVTTYDVFWKFPACYFHGHGENETCSQVEALAGHNGGMML
jgi:hypothetical protein